MGLGNMNDPPSPKQRPCRPTTLSMSNNNQPLNLNADAGCQCCPYGFHIDLDFVRFCESLATGEHLKQKRQERRARRLQCNSMEVLLGLTTPSFTPSTLPPIPDVPKEVEASALPLSSVRYGHPHLNDNLNRAVDDFEATLSVSSRNSRSSQILCNADVISNSSTSSIGKENEADVSFEIKNEALQAIRGQMAASLEKLRELEQQVKLIPVLQVKVSVLQEEKRQMALQLQDLKAKLALNAGTVKKDVAVSTLGVTLRDSVSQTESWLKSVSTKMIQTFMQSRTDSETQTNEVACGNVPNAGCVQQTSQTVQVNIPIEIEMVPKGNAETQTESETRPSEQKPTTSPRPMVFHRLIQTDKDLSFNGQPPNPPPRAIVLHRSVQTDRDSSKANPSTPPSPRKPVVLHRQIQTDSSLLSGDKQASLSLQNLLSDAKQTVRKSIAIGDGAISDILCDRCTNRRTRHVSCGTDLVRPTTGVNVATQSYAPCEDCEARSRFVSVKTVDRESQTNPEFSGSSTFTRVPKPVERPLSQSSFTTSAQSECATSTTTAQQMEHESERSEGEAESDVSSEESLQEDEEEESSTESVPPQPRTRVEPSMEMKAALKVLNDSIHRPQRASSKLLVNAIEIVRREWIRVSSTKEADAHAVEDYMDYIESLSMPLLERVANLSDNNGNTALHYAVSHSQWDIVSLLLDSKVCYPQLRNKAGYSPPMLAALAQPNNSTEIQVLQRLFSLSDVNSKATQHGQTPLMLAVSHGREEVVRLLLATGADVNVQDSDGSTALMCAAEHGHTSIVKLLLAQSEIDLDLRDNDGSTALSIAMEAGNKDIGLLIYAHMNFHRSNSSSAASSPVHPTASPLTTLKRKASPLPYI